MASLQALLGPLGQREPDFQQRQNRAEWANNDGGRPDGSSCAPAGHNDSCRSNPPIVTLIESPAS
jgi:hypothetical protein